MTRRLWITLPLATAALVAGGCGSDDSSSSSSTAASSAKPVTTPKEGLKGKLTKNCATNADAFVTAYDAKADTAELKINQIGKVAFTPSKDIAAPGKGKIKKGTHVYLTYAKGKATCLLPVNP